MECPSETRLQAFVEGELAPSAITELSSHLDECCDCRELVGAIQPVPLDDDTEPEHVGRYILRRVLGRGGMGVVYEAVDPELHRVVALKVLRSDLGGLQKRLLAEAEAMAMLSHPNVVSIYDIGRSGDRVFIVMALVAGMTLRHWLAAEPRSIPAIVDAFVQAAEGLRAAHGAGLVHRDFKPDNVFVANDGRVLVGDFGLAVSYDAEATAGEGSASYMAPEQKSGSTVDARSDQYSFCVSLQEAIADAIAKTERRRRSVPSWLSKIIARGTRLDPAARFPSMAAIIDALAAARRRTRSRRLAIGGTLGVGALIASSVFVARAASSRDDAFCRSGDAPLAAIWNDQVAERAELAFRSTNSVLAAGTWQRTRAVVDAYAKAWMGARERTCDTTHAHGEVDASVTFDRKSSCLTERLEMLRAVAASLERVDAAMLEQMPAMLQLLPRVNTCEDVRELAQLAPLPAPDRALAVDAARKKIATATTMIAAGRYQPGLELAEEASQAAKATSYLPVMADAYLAVGTARGRLGHAKEAELALEHAASSASAGHAPLVAIRAWIQLMHFVGFEGKRYDDGARYSDYAKAALESAPGAFELEVERLSWSRAMLLDQKRFDEALAASREELALVGLRLGDSHRLAAAANDGLAGVLAGQCKAKAALEPQDKACAILEKEFGAPHPQLALCLGNLAALHANLGEHARALALKERALTMFAQVPGHPNHVAMARRNLVRTLLELGRLPEAESSLEAAAAVSQRESDETTVILLRGELHRLQGKVSDALQDAALSVARTQGGPIARRLDPLMLLAESHLTASHFADAAQAAQQAETIARSVYGGSSCRIAEPLRLEVDALVGAGRADEALPLANDAMAASKDAEVDPLARARIEFAFASALRSTDDVGARTLATSARDVAANNPRGAALATRIERWLSAK